MAGVEVMCPNIQKKIMLDMQGLGVQAIRASGESGLFRASTYRGLGAHWAFVRVPRLLWGGSLATLEKPDVPSVSKEAAKAHLMRDRHISESVEI